MDLDKVFERIMLLKLIQSSGVETPYEMDLNLVGEVLFGKNYKIFIPSVSMGVTVGIVGTIKLEPERIPNVYTSDLKRFVYFFRKDNDLHLVRMGAKVANKASFGIMNRIGAKRVYWTESGSRDFILSPDFLDVENIYYHPVGLLELERITFDDYIKFIKGGVKYFLELINGNPL